MSSRSDYLFRTVSEEEVGVRRQRDANIRRTDRIGPIDVIGDRRHRAAAVHPIVDVGVTIDVDATASVTHYICSVLAHCFQSFIYLYTSKGAACRQILRTQRRLHAITRVSLAQ